MKEREKKCLNTACSTAFSPQKTKEDPNTKQAHSHNYSLQISGIILIYQMYCKHRGSAAYKAFKKLA